ncbi:MAG: hypothetical protein A2V79_08985 [Betaproteobacteria bacterium RBG_16_56_24]|nr:MAG: hypothetical protein A2V79_08985 [Betaproteobacteria bacterium RBG_16_56_24]
MKVAAKRKYIDVGWDEIIQESLDVYRGRDVIPKQDCDMDMLAEPEVECIQKTIAEYGHKSFGNSRTLLTTVHGKQPMIIRPFLLSPSLHQCCRSGGFPV